MTTTTGPRSRPSGRAARSGSAAERPAPQRARRAERATAPEPSPDEPAVRTRSARRAAPAARRPRPARRPAAPPRTPFVVLVVSLLAGALVSLLLLNTVLAQDAFELTRLQRNVKLLEQQRQAMESEIAREESPQRLGEKAENLGMTQPDQVGFIDSQGRRVGGGGAPVRPVPHAAAAAAGAAAALGVPGMVIPGDGALPGGAAPAAPAAPRP
ncbi:FtsB/FtsL family cell division protein [Thermomonospora amylolytica]|uniref:hypothetical protein n=1 Tax=Thermomonospora amylolytica TaxID=1411117 RepID=UPI000E6B54F2|nr:hypothetical protein [Thermomonospora amylolytica]